MLYEVVLTHNIPTQLSQVYKGQGKAQFKRPLMTYFHENGKNKGQLMIRGRGIGDGPLSRRRRPCSGSPPGGSFAHYRHHTEHDLRQHRRFMRLLAFQ